MFPLRFGATAALLETATPPNLVSLIEELRATICFTAPTAYRAMLAAMAEGADLSSLRIAVSAGETLPAPVYEAWTRKTGKPILDGIGSTEMLHVFVSNTLDDHGPGRTGRPVPGFEAKVVDEAMNEAPRGTVGRLAVRGPPAAAISTICDRPNTSKTAGTSPAMPSWRTRTATFTLPPAMTI